MIEIQLDNVSPDGDAHVAYVKLVDVDTGKVLQVNCLPFKDEKGFNESADALLAEFKTRYEAKEAVKEKVLQKLTALNTAEKEVAI